MRSQFRPSVLILLATIAMAARAQNAAPPPAAESGLTLHVAVNAVLVPVVVRDALGHAVGNFKQEDFKVFDQGKPRPISGFTVLQGPAFEPGALTIAPNSGVPPAVGSATQPSQAQAPASRFVIFLFDDRHLGPGDLDQVKKAATQILDEPLPEADRALVLSFLGVNSGFSHNSAPLKAAVQKLKAQQVSRPDRHLCPDLDYYTADQIANKHSSTDFQIAYEKATICSGQNSKELTSPGSIAIITQMVRTAANQIVLTGNQDVRDTLDYLRDVVHSMQKLPGQRTLVLVSPGFLSDSDEALSLQSQILDIAAASNVTISALDARGLFAGGVAAGESTAGSPFANITGQPVQNHLESIRENENVMAELADGTGGTFFHNSNDLKGGLKSLAAGPEYRYLLEFSLQGVKLNGAYHALRVEVDQPGLKLQSRRGYFAPSSSKGKN